MGRPSVWSHCTKHCTEPSGKSVQLAMNEEKLERKMTNL